MNSTVPFTPITKFQIDPNLTKFRKAESEKSSVIPYVFKDNVVKYQDDRWSENTSILRHNVKK